MAQQRVGAVADEVDRGLVAGDVEQDHLVEQLVGGEAVTGVLGGEERGEQVVGGMGALPLDGIEHVLDDVVGRRQDLVLVLDREQRFEAEGEGVRPGAQLPLLRLRHAEQLRDHPERQREREIGDHVHAVAPRHDRVEGVVDHRLHARCQLLDRSRREDLLDQLAEPGVVRRVEVEDLAGPALGAVAQDLLPQLGAWIRADDAVVLDAQARVPEEADGVVVAEERPQPERRLLDPVRGRELRELGIRVDREARFERVEGPRRRDRGFRLIGHISHSVTRGCAER